MFVRPNAFLFATSILLAILPRTGGESTPKQNPLHASIAGQTYKDDRITVTVPAGWTLEWSVQKFYGEAASEVQGVVLRKGSFVLTLCSGCQQASGVEGGRFSEIAALVQPWARRQEPAEACGTQILGAELGKIQRRDFVYGATERRKPYASSMCVMPKDSRSRWYGSYYSPSCLKSKRDQEVCGSFFLDRDWLAGQPLKQDVPPDEMAFGLSYATRDVNTLPSPTDSALKAVEREADEIVASIRYR